MNRPESAFAALLLTIVAAVPAATQPAARLPQPASIEFCTGCFAYLEFPPLPEEPALSAPVSAQHETLPSAISHSGESVEALKPSAVSSVTP